MYLIMILLFVIGYIAIALEHPIKVDKSATALLIGTLIWAVFITSGHHTPEAVLEELNHHITGIAGILFFLMGAMAIVEVIDAHDGFSSITDRINTTNKVKLLWILGIITFFLSAALDNLTTAIVMISLTRKLVAEQKDKWFFGGIIVIAANAGGAWSPIGDVTTTMLWIGKQISTEGIILKLLLPSLVSLVVPMLILSFTMKGQVTRPEGSESKTRKSISKFEKNTVFIIGLGGLLFVPVFKTITHLPPFMGMLLSLGVLWLTTELLHKRKHHEAKHPLSVIGALRRVEFASMLFFLGILTAIAGLESAGILANLANFLDEKIGNIYVINIVIGALSAVVDNVPLVAAAQGMYPLERFVIDHDFWQFLAYCAGTGGSMLIIGSAAGVAIMGIEKINFIWYAKKITIWALLGYLAGAATYILLFSSN